MKECGREREDERQNKRCWDTLARNRRADTGAAHGKGGVCLSAMSGKEKRGEMDERGNE